MRYSHSKSRNALISCAFGLTGLMLFACQDRLESMGKSPKRNQFDGIQTGGRSSIAGHFLSSSLRRRCPEILHEGTASAGLDVELLGETPQGSHASLLGTHGADASTLCRSGAQEFPGRLQRRQRALLQGIRSRGTASMHETIPR